jgi:hypothetical protein
MWKELKKVHQTSLVKINYLFEELYTCKYINGNLMDEHIVAMLDLSHQIISAGKKLEDLHLTWTMVLSLLKTPSWELVKIPLFKLATFTSEAVSMRLLQKANHWKHERDGSETTLFMKRKHGKGKGKSKGKGTQPNDKCHCCSRQGYWAKDCEEPEAKRKANKKSSGGSTHLAVSGLQKLDM